MSNRSAIAWFNFTLMVVLCVAIFFLMWALRPAQAQQVEISVGGTLGKWELHDDARICWLEKRYPDTGERAGGVIVPQDVSEVMHALKELKKYVAKAEDELKWPESLYDAQIANKQCFVRTILALQAKNDKGILRLKAAFDELEHAFYPDEKAGLDRTRFCFVGRDQTKD